MNPFYQPVAHIQGTLPRRQHLSTVLASSSLPFRQSVRPGPSCYTPQSQRGASFQSTTARQVPPFQLGRPSSKPALTQVALKQKEDSIGWLLLSLVVIVSFLAYWKLGLASLVLTVFVKYYRNSVGLFNKQPPQAAQLTLVFAFLSLYAMQVYSLELMGYPGLLQREQLVSVILSSAYLLKVAAEYSLRVSLAKSNYANTREQMCYVLSRCFKLTSILQKAVLLCGIIVGTVLCLRMVGESAKTGSAPTLQPKSLMVVASATVAYILLRFIGKISVHYQTFESSAQILKYLNNSYLALKAKVYEHSFRCKNTTPVYQDITMVVHNFTSFLKSEALFAELSEAKTLSMVALGRTDMQRADGDCVRSIQASLKEMLEETRAGDMQRHAKVVEESVFVWDYFAQRRL